MAFFHGTRFSRMPSILEHGLGWAGAEQNWEGCARGVYLAGDPSISVFVMLEQFMKYGRDDDTPKALFADMCVIVIDDSRIDRRRLGPDPLIERTDVWLSDGVIDVRSQTVIDVDAVMAGFTPQPDTEESDRAFAAWVRHCMDER